MQEFYLPCSEIFDKMHGQTFIINTGLSSYSSNSENKRSTISMNRERRIVKSNITSDNVIVPSFAQKIIQKHFCEDISEIICNLLTENVMDICIDTYYVLQRYALPDTRNVEHIVISEKIKKSELFVYVHSFFGNADYCLSSYNIKTNIRDKAMWKILMYFFKDLYNEGTIFI